MQCPVCGKRTRVMETRTADDGAAMRRRRACRACGQRFSTVERILTGELSVRKRDGSRVRYEREKVLGGMLRAAHKRPVDRVAIERIADRIEAEALAAGGEIAAARIGELALSGLRELDRVAYLQFAAVYKGFSDASEFSAELAEIDRGEDASVSAELAEIDRGEGAGGGSASVGSVRPERDPA